MKRFECGQEKEYILKDSFIYFNDKKIDPVPLKTLLPEMFQEIKNGKGSFSCPIMESVMETLHIERIKSTSLNKDDFKIKFHSSEKFRGFNVKSKLGSKASIINASKKTNFIYEIVNFNFPYDELNKTGPKNVVKTIYEKGGNIIFRECFESYRMQLQDATKIFSILLLEYFKGNGTNISNLVDQIFERKTY